MFRFENPDYLYLLWLVPVLAGGMLIQMRRWKRERLQLADTHLFHRLLPQWRGTYKWVRFSLVLTIFSLLVISLSNPQWATKREKVKSMSADIIIALDISQSMMVKDIPPNRLEKAKKLVENLILALKGNRIGLIFFAGEAFIQMPLTTDYASALMFLKSANTRQIASQGTAIVEAVELAERSFVEGEPRQRAMVIVTDGEDHDGQAVERAAEARSSGMHIFTVGIGTPEGDFIPYINQFGVETYKKGPGGEFLRSKVNVALLDEIAQSGGGRFYSALSGDSTLEELVGELELIEKRENEQRSFTSYESYYQYFLILAIMLLIIEFIWPEKWKENPEM